jgi:hypothetical protein
MAAAEIAVRFDSITESTSVLTVEYRSVYNIYVFTYIDNTQESSQIELLFWYGVTVDDRKDKYLKFQHSRTMFC